MKIREIFPKMENTYIFIFVLIFFMCLQHFGLGNLKIIGAVIVPALFIPHIHKELALKEIPLKKQFFIIGIMELFIIVLLMELATFGKLRFYGIDLFPIALIVSFIILGIIKYFKCSNKYYYLLVAIWSFVLISPCLGV